MAVTKVLATPRTGVYSACKTRVFERNIKIKRPNRSILSVTVYERPSKNQKKNPNEHED